MRRAPAKLWWPATLVFLDADGGEVSRRKLRLPIKNGQAWFTVPKRIPHRAASARVTLAGVAPDVSSVEVRW